MVRPKPDDPKPPKDANEALLAGRNLQEFLDGEGPARTVYARAPLCLTKRRTENCLYFFAVLCCRLAGARNRAHDDIVTFRDLREDVLHELQVQL